MSKKARQRLIIVTGILVVAFIAGVIYFVTQQGAYYRQVSDLATQQLDGKTVKVGGAVVGASIRRDGSGVHFTMQDLTGKPATVKVDYDGQMPGTFGAGVDVVVTGPYSRSGGVISADSLQTKCPSKYKGLPSPQAQPSP